MTEFNEYLTHTANDFMYRRFSHDVIFGIRAFTRIIIDLLKVYTAITTITLLLDEYLPHAFIFLLNIGSTFYILSHSYWQLRYIQIQLNLDLELMIHRDRDELRGRSRVRQLMLSPSELRDMLGIPRIQRRESIEPSANAPARNLPTRITWITPEANANQAGYSYLVTSREHQRLRYFLNRETFVAREPVNEIEPENLLILDGYAFAIDELIAYANTSLQAIYRNPHLLDRARTSDFSLQAQDRMRNYPRLIEYILKFENHLLNQSNTLRQEVIPALIRMLNQIDRSESRREWNAAREDFIKYVSTLNKWQQQNLYAYIIEVAYIEGGFHRLDFQGALGGGYSNCVQVLQIFLWQFVVTQRPEHFRNIPENVHQMAFNSNFRITARVYANEIPQMRARPASMPTAPQPAREEMLDDSEISQFGIVIDLGFFSSMRRTTQSTVRMLSGIVASIDEAKEDSISFRLD